MANKSLSDTQLAEIDEYLKDDSFCKMIDTQRNAACASQHTNVTEASAAATPDPLNNAFLDETVVEEGPTTTETCENHTQTIETTTTAQGPPLVHEIIEQGNNDANHRTPTKPEYVSIGTMLKTPTNREYVTTGTMPKTPNVDCIETMASTTTTKSTATMTETSDQKPMTKTPNSGRFSQ
ncbi:unnamed protein product [Didymodactylos carnosus]|uniref:Uncharacterized protein n=1 Tax=Didymodactylos carnosus TaxID=1234261 RepID=A0A8S2MBA0_9BILA|nr:unnamed protein product [Didymodactylos carnosus]CAF3948349.1 unnamed protein product [Didymodactylos carnosus]